ncbi:MAG: caspase family protein [Rubrivivax sp.]|nr:caspase family protein [Rubrivivax sp.]
MLLPGKVPAQPVSDAPFPALEAGMHTAAIVRFAVDRAGRYGVSVAGDKTARVWDLASGRALQTLRVPVGSDNEGKLFAAAVSPDGERVAVGGWTNKDGLETSVYLFDRATGRLVGRIPALPNTVNHLAWSPDGRRIAVALGSGSGIRLHAAAPPYAEVARDTAYPSSSFSIDFDRAGRVVSTAEDGKVRLYDATLRLLVAPRALPGGEAFFARFSPNGERIAVGFYDSTAVQVLSAADLTPLRVMDTSAAELGNLSAVSWSADGRRLFAAGTNQLPDGQMPVRVFDPTTGRALAAWPVATSTVPDLQALADGRLVFASQAPTWGVLDGEGRMLTRQDSPIPDHRGEYNNFRLSRTGDLLAFRHAVWQQGRWSRQSLGFDLRRLVLGPAETLPAPELAAPRIDGLPMRAEDWRDTLTPTFAGRRVDLHANERSRSLAISADARHFALGGEYTVRWFNAQGTQQWVRSLPGVAWLVNTSRDGRFVVAALGDGTIRWYRTDDKGSEALALFVHADGRRWVLWTPEGFFAASPDGEALMGYVLNQGSREREAEFVSAAQLREAFYRPDLIVRRIEGDEAAIRAALADVGDVRRLLGEGLPPQLELLSEASPVVAAGGDYELRLRITPRKGGVGRLALRVNGAAQDAGRDPAPMGGVYSQRLRYPPGSYRLEVAVFDARSQVASKTQRITLEVRGAAPKPQLHLLSVGVSRAVYADSKLATAGVEFADRDARAFVQRMAGQAGDGRLYRTVTSRVLTTKAETSRDAIEGAFAAVPFEAGDTVVVFLAGHGRALKNKYHFLPADLAIENEDSIGRHALTQDRLEKLLRRFATGRVLLVLDTCHAGAMTESRGIEEAFAIGDLMRQTGQVVLAASRSDALAFQDRKQQHGIFTLALLDGLKEADYDRDGVVDAEELAKYVAREVPARSERANPGGPRQVPMRSPTPNAFPLVPAAGSGR